MAKTIDSMLDDMFSDVFDEILGESDTFKDDPEFIYEGGKEPVDIVEFVESSEFLGLNGRIYPVIMDSLVHIEQGNIREGIMLLGKGSGKTTAMTLFMSYEIYKLLMLKDPQKHYNLLPQDQIVALIVSVSEKQAKSVGFARVSNIISNSPWFRGKYTALTTEIRFEKDITFYCGHSGATSWLGYNTLVACMDEVEYMKDSNNRSVSKELYRALKGSLLTRYPDDYKLLLISSPKAYYSFLNSRFEDKKVNAKRIKMKETR